jgi:sulfur-carrier protein
MEILYYGSLRDAIGRDREEIEPPSHVLTVEDLLAWLRGRGAPYVAAMADGAGIRAAVGGEWLEAQDSLFGAVEAALTPPVGVL